MEALLGGAFVAHMGHKLWSYNRDNWMWDGQIKQGSNFQLQQVGMNRYGLYREDLRDLTDLTTGRLSSYLVVSTVKLGFMVALAFNYDRTNTGMKNNTSGHEHLFRILFVATLLMTFFFLLTSIWFAMHASVVAQSFLTKMLVQTVRIPFASDGQIDGAAPLASEIETSVDKGFRLPFFKKDVMGSFANPLAKPLANSDSDPGVQLRQRTGSGTRSPGEGMHDRPDEQQDVLGAAAEVAEDQGAIMAHVKFYRLLMTNWQPFDVYSQVSMSIGTCAFLQGMSYFGLYYNRYETDGQSDEILDPHIGGWFTFAFMSVLAWLFSLLDLVLTTWEHILFFALGIGGPLLIAVITLVGPDWLWLMPIGFFMQGLWNVLLCVTALPNSIGMPRRWRAALLMDVFDDRLTASTEQAQLQLAVEAAKSSEVLLFKLSAALKGPGNPIPEDIRLHLHESRDIIHRELEASRPSSMKDFNVQRYFFDDGFWLGFPPKEGDDVTEEEDRVRVQVQWVDLVEDEAGRWAVDAGPEGGPSPGDVQTKEDLRRDAQRLAEQLSSATLGLWTSGDKDRLAGYGGKAWSSPQDFEGTLRPSKKVAKPESRACRFFRYGTIVIAIMWVSAVVVTAGHCWFGWVIDPGSDVDWRNQLHPVLGSYLAPTGARRSRPTRVVSTPAAVVWRQSIQLPRPWFTPTALSCAEDGRVAVTDGVRAYVGRLEETGWSHPFSPLTGDDVAAIAFGPSGRLFGASASGGCISQLYDRTARAQLPDMDGHARAAASCWSRIETAAGPRQAPDHQAFQAFALDTARGRRRLQGLLVRPGGGGLVEVAQNRDGSWNVGLEIAPGNRSWASVSLHSGQVFALDSVSSASRSSVFVLDMASGEWLGGWALSRGVAWKSICARAGGGWLALGFNQSSGGAEIWHFNRPGSSVDAVQHLK